MDRETMARKLRDLELDELVFTTARLFTVDAIGVRERNGSTIVHYPRKKTNGQ